MQLLVNIGDSGKITPAEQQSRQRQAQKIDKQSKVQQHDTVQAIVSTFDATIVDDST